MPMIDVCVHGVTSVLAPPPPPSRERYRIAIVGGVTALLLTFGWHSTWVASEIYSSPSIVLSATRADGGRVLFDDFREAYVARPLDICVSACALAPECMSRMRRPLGVCLSPLGRCLSPCARRYWWLRMNTPVRACVLACDDDVRCGTKGGERRMAQENARVLSWWDYGYQVCAAWGNLM